MCTLVKLDQSQAGLNGRVLVPSRCYFEQSAARPLDGARISVKDNIDIAGHKTTLCNRAWEYLYSPKSKHADCVQIIIGAGAIIVAKVKLQAMIMREEPLECVEFTAPFNPRADEYQVPSGSSHGSAAGIGSYDWLDYSLQSDSKRFLLPICLLSSFDLPLDVAHTLQQTAAEENRHHTTDAFRYVRQQAYSIPTGSSDHQGRNLTR